MHPLTAYRKRHDPPKTLREVADEIGVRLNTVWRWEKGRLPARAHWPKIQEATGIPPEDLIRHTGSPA